MQIDLYNAEGDPVAYIFEDADDAIYLWDGWPVCYVMDEKVYGWNGKHIGWFVEGRIYDRGGDRVGETLENCKFPNRPSNSKLQRKQRMQKRQRESARARPRLTQLYSLKPLSVFLEDGRW